MTEEEYFRKNYPDSCYGDRPLSPYWDFFQDGVEFAERQSEKKLEELETENRLLGERCNQLLKDKGELTDKVDNIKSNCDLAIEGRDIKIKELEKEKQDLRDNYDQFKVIAEPEIERLKKENAELKHNKKTVAHLADCLEEKMKERIEELERLNSNQAESLRVTMLEEEKKGKRIAELEKQIEKMKNCGNCKYGYCGGSSISIDKDGNRTFHNWNEEKQAYCDIGKNGKYQCWEIKEND